MKVTILGTGTSHGIPVVNCDCDVCRSEIQENKRYRCSIYMEKGNTGILIDTTPEFRLQAVRAKIKQIDAILFTHAHADHLHGLDDIRPYSYKKEIPVYAGDKVCKEIKERFPYIFTPPLQKGGGTPNLTLNRINRDPFTIGDFEITPLPVYHGSLKVLGFRTGSFAYITDCSRIPGSTMDLLKGVKHLVLGALRYRPHETHFTIDQALEIIKKISPERAYLTHLCHEVEHFKLKDELYGLGVEPAFDGQVISVTL